METGAGYYVAKADMKSVFRNLPICPQDWMLLVMMVEHPTTHRKYYFVDKCLPFGASISCSHFQRFSNCVAFLVRKRTGKRTNNYLDDFFFTALLQALCNGHVKAFMEICEVINFPVAPEKTVWGTTVIVFLGILINIVTQSISIPVAKRDKTVKMLENLMFSRTITVQKLQQLTGLLNFLSRAVVPGRTFTRMMYVKYSYRNLKQHYHVRVDSELKSDCLVWLEFLNDQASLCRPFMDFSKCLTADVLNFYTDTSGSAKHGFGCVFDKEWTWGRWNSCFITSKRPSIEYLELFGVAVAIVLWADRLQNRRVVIFCDNQSVVQMINDAVSSCRNCMVLIRIITLTSIKFNVRFFARYVESADNTLADALSRGQFFRFWKNAGVGMNPFPTPLPQKLWPMEKLWINV